MPNNEVTVVPSTVTANFTFTGATSVDLQVLSQSDNSIYWYSGLAPDGGFFNFDFSYPDQWIVFRVSAANSCGSSFYDAGFYSSAAPGMYAYSPNPASNTLRVEYTYKTAAVKDRKIKKDFEVKLINNKGIAVKAEKNRSETNTILLDISNLPDDTYFLHITEGKKVIKKQIIIQH